MRAMVLLLGLLAIPAASRAQSASRPEILVLGTYHMGNPGRDVHNMEADDVLSSRRQQEIAQLMVVLKKFRPTKIAIEAAVGSQRVAREYADFLAGKYTLTRNEIDQVGFRLARELDHRSVYPVDVDGEFQFMRVSNYAKANGRMEQFDAIQASIGRKVKEQGEFLRSHTVLETLELMNSDSMVARAVASDLELVSFGDAWEYAGPDLLAFWYQRNLRIYNRIAALIESPNDRILVIYGSGHLGPFRQIVGNDARVRLRKLADFNGRQ